MPGPVQAATIRAMTDAVRGAGPDPVPYPHLDPVALALGVLADGPAKVDYLLRHTTGPVLRHELLRRAVADAEAAMANGGSRAVGWLMDRAGGDLRRAIGGGFTRMQVRRALVATGRAERADRHERIRHLRRQGHSLAAIARKVGCSLGQVRTVVERAEHEGLVPVLEVVMRSNGVRSPARFPLR